MSTYIPYRRDSGMIFAALLFLATMFAGALVWGAVGIASLKNDAVSAGVARWTVDEKTGATKFEWIKPEGKE